MLKKFKNSLMYLGKKNYSVKYSMSYKDKGTLCQIQI